MDSNKDRIGDSGTAAGSGAMPAARGQRLVRDTALQQGLRAAYRTVIEEPLPDRFQHLLDQLGEDGPTK